MIHSVQAAPFTPVAVSLILLTSALHAPATPGPMQQPILAAGPDLSPTSTARQLSLRAPARTSEALALRPLISTVRGVWNTAGLRVTTGSGTFLPCPSTMVTVEPPAG